MKLLIYRLKRHSNINTHYKNLWSNMSYFITTCLKWSIYLHNLNSILNTFYLEYDWWYTWTKRFYHMGELDATNPECEVHRYPPTKVKFVSNLWYGIGALASLLKPEDTENVLIEGRYTPNTLYEFFDTSREVFESTLSNTNKNTSPDGIQLSVSIWQDKSKKMSSNFRYFQNLVEAVENRQN